MLSAFPLTSFDLYSKMAGKNPAISRTESFAGGHILLASSPFLHFARNSLRALPCNPLASASFEHSFDLAALAAASAGAAGAAGAGAVACAKATLTENMTATPAETIAESFMGISSWLDRLKTAFAGRKA
jgi:hypothetical protein